MSRRKQPKPQHVLSDHYLPLIDYTEDVHLETPISIDSCLCVCSKCCAEFSDHSCLEQHQMECSPNQLVMIVNENEDLFSHAEMLPSASSSPKSPVESSERVNTFKTEDFSDPVEENIEDIMDCSVEENVSSNSSNQNGSCNGGSTESIVDHVLCASVQTSLPQPGNQSEQGKLSWLSSDVIIENLEGTKVAVAQFSKQFHSDVTSISNSKIAVSSLVEHLLALQLQQIQQLQLIDEIRHKVLLFDSNRLELSDSSLRCSRDTLSSKRANERTTFSSNLAQQIATASDTVQSLASQSASIVHLKQSAAKVQFSQSKLGGDTELCSWEPLNVVGKPKTLEVIEKDPEKQPIDSADTCTKTFFSSQHNMASLAFSIGGLKDGSSNPHLAQPLPVCHKGSRSFGAVEGDMNGLATLAKPKKLKTTHILEQNTSSKDILFKHKCRFCAKVFGSDSALQIHLRSHTGERPYKCNICGNRFSTRGNLKVHFQRHKDRHPHIQMNPYPVPEHLDNLQTNNGIPYGMAMPPPKPLTGWLDSRLHLASLTSGLMLSSTSLTRHVKNEKQPASPPNPSSPGVHSFDVTEKSFISSDYSGAGKGNILAVKREGVIPSLKPYSKMALLPEGSSSPLPNEIPPIEMHLNNSGLSTFEETHHSRISETSKLQQLVENIYNKATGTNECVICHRTLSCQGALKMHYRTHTGERPYRCNECGRAFSTKGNLKMHNAVHRAVPPKCAQHSCPICNQTFTSAVVLQQHIHMHMAGDVPNVQLPSQSFGKPMDEGLRDSITWNSLDTFSGDDKDFYGSHIVSVSEYDCLSTSSSTNIGASSINALIRNGHSDSTGDKQWSCLKMYKNEGLHKEKNQEYNSLFPEEDQCGNKISAIKNPNIDTFNSGVIISSPTHLPSAIKFASSNNKLHNPPRDTTHNISERLLFKNIVCDICGKTFACQSALDIHYRSHTKERPFICTECNRGFSTKGNLKQHMLTHQMRDLPPQLFEPSNPSLLSSSKPPVLPGGTQKIKTEHTGFLSASHGEAGGRVGSSITSSVPVSPVPVPPQRRMAKQHYCHTCGKVFSSSSALQIHERTHTGEKPFACTVCRRAFTTKGNLKVHMGTHMWNSGPIRRGRRLFADGILAFSRPEKRPEPPERTTAAVEGDSVYQWSHRAVPFSRGSSTNDITVIQNGRTNIVWDKQRQTDQKCLLEIYDSSNIDQKNPFCFTRPIKDRKEMVAN